MSEQRVEQRDAASAPQTADQSQGTFTIVYGEPIPDDLRALAADLVPAGFRLLVVTSREREELLRLMPEADSCW